MVLKTLHGLNKKMGRMLRVFGFLAFGLIGAVFATEIRSNFDETIIRSANQMTDKTASQLLTQQ